MITLHQPNLPGSISLPLFSKLKMTTCALHAILKLKTVTTETAHCWPYDSQDRLHFPHNTEMDKQFNWMDSTL